MSESVNVKEHVINLINALANLSPSRNVVSQLTLLLPGDVATIERSYEGVTRHDVGDFLRSLGVKIGERVERTEKSFSEELYKHVHRTLDWLDDECIYMEWVTLAGYGGFEKMMKMDEVRSNLAKLTGLYIDSIPNPYAEWAKLVLGKLSAQYGRDRVLGLLKALLAQAPRRDRDDRGKSLRNFLDKIGAEIGFNPADLEELKRFMILVKERSEHLYHKGSTRYPEGDIWIEHSMYHTDPLICESYRYEGYGGWGYDYEYRVRHKESLLKAIEETQA